MQHRTKGNSSEWNDEEGYTDPSAIVAKVIVVVKHKRTEKWFNKK